MNESGFKLYLICISVAATPAPAAVAVAFLLESSKPFIGTKNNYIYIQIHVHYNQFSCCCIVLYKKYIYLYFDYLLNHLCCHAFQRSRLTFLRMICKFNVHVHGLCMDVCVGVCIYFKRWVTFASATENACRAENGY